MRDIKYIRRVGAGVYFYIATVTVKSRPKARVTLVLLYYSKHSGIKMPSSLNKNSRNSVPKS